MEGACAAGSSHHEEKAIQLLLEGVILRHHDIQLSLQLQFLRLHCGQSLLQLLDVGATAHARHCGGFAVHIQTSFVALLFVGLTLVREMAPLVASGAFGARGGGGLPWGGG